MLAACLLAYRPSGSQTGGWGGGGGGGGGGGLFIGFKTSPTIHTRTPARSRGTLPQLSDGKLMLGQLKHLFYHE